MTIEQSHGKARPTLPRLSDVNPGTVPERAGERDDGGRFAVGNAAARGRGWKRAVRGLLGAAVEDPVAS